MHSHFQLESKFCIVELNQSRKLFIAHLFFGTVATDHPGGEFHGVVLVLVVAPIAGISPATARKPKKRGHKAFTDFSRFLSNLVRQKCEMR